MFERFSMSPENNVNKGGLIGWSGDGGVNVICVPLEFDKSLCCLQMICEVFVTSNDNKCGS